MTDPCQGCDATCCAHYAIHVLPAEVEHIAAHLGRAPATFVELEHESLSPELPAAFLEGGPAQLALKRDPDTDACAFLDGAARRCTIHAHRPYICRMYPFKVGDDGRFVLTLRQDRYCPGPFPLGDDEARVLREEARRFWTRDLDAYRVQVQRWNHGLPSGGLEAFLAFCRER